MKASQKGPGADGASLEAAYRELQATFQSQRAELESQLTIATAELAEVRPALGSDIQKLLKSRQVKSRGVP